MGSVEMTCAPVPWACAKGAARVMPVPETSTPAACPRVSGPVTVIAAPPLKLVEATTAVS